MSATAGLFLRAACLALLLTLVGPVSAAPPGSAAAIAQTQKAEREIEQRFVAEVAALVKTSPAKIERLIPQRPRIADRGQHLIQAIGMKIRPLSDTEQQALLRADERRREALGRLRSR